MRRWFLVTIILCLGLFISVPALGAVPAIYFGYLGGSSQTTSSDQGLFNGTPYLFGEKQDGDLSGYWLEAEYPLKEFKFGLNYSNSTVNLLLVKTEHLLFDTGRSRMYLTASWLNFSAQGVQTNGTSGGLEGRYRFNSTFSVNGRINYPLSSSRQLTEGSHLSTFTSYHLRFDYLIREKLGIYLGCQNYNLTGSNSLYSDVDNYNNSSVDARHYLYSLGLFYIFGLEAMPPEIFRAEPSQVINGGLVKLKIKGRYFQNGALVTLIAPDGTVFSSEDIAVENANLINCSFDLQGEPAGQYGVKVVNPDGWKAMKRKILNVTPAPFVIASPFVLDPPAIILPAIRDLSPNEGVNTGVVQAIINGANLQAGAQVGLTFGAKTIKGENIKVENGLLLSCLFDLTGKPAGTYDLTVTNPDGQKAALEKAFTVKEIKVTFQELNQQMPNIHFDTNKTAIRPDQIPALNTNLIILKAHPELQIILRGHADPRGDKFYNMELSLKRAEVVKAYLIKEGIGPQRIKLEAYGSDRLLEKGDNETAWAKNRRVETLLVEFKPETFSEEVDQK